MTPHMSEFFDALETRDVYAMRSCAYLLDRHGDGLMIWVAGREDGRVAAQIHHQPMLVRQIDQAFDHGHPAPDRPTPRAKGVAIARRDDREFDQAVCVAVGLGPPQIVQ